jgi:hypothetical protein
MTTLAEMCDHNTESSGRRTFKLKKDIVGIFDPYIYVNER